ncbi:MAG: 50S ribosomal protein L32e [Nanopusillaceae archaeon]
MREKLLKLRKKIKRKKPDYWRPYWWRSISQRNSMESWRRPKGIHNKMRKKLKGRPRMVEVGYGSPKEIKGLLPNGKRPVIVHNVEELEKIDKEKEAAIIASTVGKRKREQIINKAKELNIEIFNI